MGVYIYEEQNLPSVTDSTGRSYSNYGGSDQGICITAKIDCTLDRVTTAGVAETLNIAQGTGWGVYDADTLVQYSLGGSSDYTLPTPYEMEANTNYVIWVTGGGPIGYSNIRPLPLNGTNITTNYSISLYGNQSKARAITSVTTTPVGVHYEEKELKNAYIGEYRVPGVNTIAYYKFDGNLNDSSGNNRNLSMSTGSFTYGTESGGGKYVYMNRNSWSNYWEDNINFDNTTLSFRRKGTSSSPASGATAFIEIWSASDQSYIRCQQNIQFAYRTGFTYNAGISWHHYVVVSQVNTSDLYVDGVKVTSGAADRTGTKTIRFRLNQVADTNSSTYSNDGYLGELIRESKEWTAEDVAKYYNSTKSNYGL